MIGIGVIILGWIIFTVFSAIAITFILTCLHEREWRAAGNGILFFFPLLGIFVVLLILDSPVQQWIILFLLILGGIFVLLITLPFHSIRPIRIIGKQEQVDERDALFHRFYRLKTGTPEFEAYYRDHPEKATADKII